MVLTKRFLAFVCLVIATAGQAQNIATYNAVTKSLFPSRGKEFLASHGDTLMLINSLQNRKELWVYRASADSTEKHKAEIFYKAYPFNFSSRSIAFYDVIMNRFIFSKLQNGGITDYLGDKLKGVGEESIGLSLPHFYPYNNHWLVLSLAGFAYMDNKLFYGFLTEEGAWAIPPQSLFEYPEGLTQSFGLIKAYTATLFNNKFLICSEVTGNHPIAKENGFSGGLFVLSEISNDFTVNRTVVITDERDSVLLSKDKPSTIELLAMDDRLALIVKNEQLFCVKIYDSDFKPLKQIPIVEGVSVAKQKSLPIAKGFISTFSTAENLSVAYITKDGLVRKRWVIHSGAMDTADFYCMKDGTNFYVVINDKQANEVIRKTISIADLEK